MVDPGHRERGLKAAIKNPRVSEQAKQRDREILENEYGGNADPEYIPAGAEASSEYITEEVPTTTTAKMPKSKMSMPESEAMMPEPTSTIPKKSTTTGTTSAYSAEKAMPASMPQSSSTTTSSMPKSSASGSTGSSNTTSDYSANKAMRAAAPPTRSGMMLPEETETKNPGNVIGGLKAAIANKNVSDAAKGRDHQKLRDLGAE